LKKNDKRIIHDDNSLTKEDLPDDLCYGARTNLDRNSINDKPPKFTICIKASSMKKRVQGTSRT